MKDLQLKGFFITGTDTDAGKTEIAAGIIHKIASMGYQVVGMKPIASGCDQTDFGLRNSDALKLIAAANTEVSYDLINPYTFKDPIAPHIAAQQNDIEIKMDVILDCYRQIAEKVEVVVVEGVGGWAVPISKTSRMDDLAHVLDLPVVLVVGIHLGCINHALLTYEAIKAKGLRVAGWVANYVSPKDLCIEEQKQSISERISAPLLGEIPFNATINAEFVAKHLEIDL